jgi:hypothetical protein
MTRFIHDRFAKEYLEGFLSPLGTVNIGQDVTSEVREIDVSFTPNTANPEYSSSLGLLGKMAQTPAIFEPFRNPASTSEICSCLSKLLDVREDKERESRRENTRLTEESLPKLWILVPTASQALIDSFNAKPDEENWMKGIYFLGSALRTAIVVIHQLPVTPETLWLRILGKGKVQQRACTELSALATDDPRRAIALELLYRLQSNLVADIQEQLEPEEQELIMAIAPLFQQQIEAAQQQAREEGRQEQQRFFQQQIEAAQQQAREEERQEQQRFFQQQIEAAQQQAREEGRQEQQRLILDNFLRVRFAQLPPKMIVLLPLISKLSAEEFTVLLVALSMLSVDESELDRAIKLLAENALKIRSNELGELLPTAVTNLLAFSEEELTFFVEQIPQLSADDLRQRLGISFESTVDN